MSIDKSGEFWRGSHLYDLYEYLKHASVWQTLVQPTCSCGCREFFLDTDHESACARSRCTNCRQERRLCDDEEQWARADLTQVVCPCGAAVFQLGLGIEEEPTVGWTILGHRCVACGIMGYSPNRSETVPFGKPGVVGEFADLITAPRILKAYPLHLYEVIYWGGAYDEDGANGRDAIYLVAAKDYQDAVDVVDRNLSHWNETGQRPQADVVQEVANNLTQPTTTKIVRGPYFAQAYLWGAAAWGRTSGDDDWQPYPLADPT